MTCLKSSRCRTTLARDGRWRRCLTTLVTASAFLACGAPSAMADWHAPVDLASGDPSQGQGVGIGGAPVALSGSGVATVLYGVPAPSAQSAAPAGSFQYLSRSRPAGSSTFGPPEVVRQFPADQYGVNDPRLVSDAQGNLTAAWLEFGGQAPYTYSVVAARRPVGGSWSAPTTVHTAAPGMTVESLTRLVSGPDGGVGLTWQDCQPNYNQPSFCQEEVGLLPHGATAWAVSQLDQQYCNRISGSALTLGGGDLAAVTFATPTCDQYGNPTQDTAKAAVTTVTSTAFGSVLPFDNGTMADRSESIAFDASGRATALWSSTTPDGTASTLQVATSAGSGWGPATTLPGSNDVISGRLGSDNAGDLTAVWETFSATASTETVQVASRPAGGSWTAPHQLAQTTTSQPNSEQLGSFPQLRTDPNGESVALWDTFTPTSDGSRGPTRLYLDHASSSGVWEAPQVIDTEQGSFGYAPFATAEDGFAANADLAFVAGVDTFVAWNRYTYSDATSSGYPINETLQATWTSPDASAPASGATGGTPAPSDPGSRPYVDGGALPPPDIFVSYAAPSDPYMRIDDGGTLRLAANDSAFVSYGCNAGQPSGHRVSSCQMTAYGPDGSVTPVGSGAAEADLAGADLPTAYPAICGRQSNPCQYTVRVDATNTDGVRTGLGFRYLVSPPPSAAGEQAALNSSINAQLGTIDSAFASLAQGYETLDDSGHNPICFIARNGQVIAAGSGNIIAAGSGNVIAAGSGNIIAAGSHNFQVVNGGGQTVAIIAAGSGNLQVIAADGVIAAGSGNVIAAGSGNVIAAGSGNLVAASGGGIIAAGAYNLVPRDGASIGPQFAAAVLPVSGLLSAGSLIGRIDTAGLVFGAAASSPRGIAARTRPTTHIARGTVVLGYHGEKARLVLVLTGPGKRLIAKLARRNAVLRRAHKHLHILALHLTETFIPKAGSKAITLTRRFTITPGHQKGH